MTLFCLSTWAASVVADRPEETNAASSRSPFAYANVDPLDDDLVKPPDVRPTCEADLAAASIAYQPDKLTPLVQPDTKIVCGAPQVVAYRESPSKIAWSPSVLTTCTMALAIARFETIVQEEAVRAFDRRVAHIHHLGTFDCRPMLAFPGWVSEHSYANAIDVAEFVLEDGTSIKIYDHFAPKQPVATTKEAAFLRKIARRAYDEEVFSSVLTPFFDRHHVDHFHFDLARTRSDGAAFVKPR